MKADLDLVRSKIEWANKHIANLGRECRTIFDPKPNNVIAQYDLQADKTVYQVVKLPNISADIFFIAGDAIHNLRSALDYLAWQLVLANNKVPRGGIGGTGFPIFESLKQYEAKAPGKIEGMCETAKKIIRGFDPYKGGNPVLWLLHDLDISDKHRLPISLAPFVHKWGVNLGSIADDLQQIWTGHNLPNMVWIPSLLPIPANVKNGDKLFELPGDSSKDEDVKIAFNVAFGEGRVPDGESLIESLQRFSHFIKDVVIGNLACCFE
jgi:hypothetical protein